MSTQQETFKKRAAIQRKINEKRIDDMHQIQEQLREKFIEVNQFMKECTDKTERAENQIANETEQQEQLTKEIEVMRHDINKLAAFEEKFKEIVIEFQPYADVFNKIIESTEFESFEDIMSRCDSLSKSHLW